MRRPASGAPETSGREAMAKPIHMMVRVKDEARSVDFYRKAFGLEIAERVDFPDFTLIYMRPPQGDFEVELTVNKGRTEPYNLGDGYGHMAFVTDDLEAERARMTARARAQGHQADDPRRQAVREVLLHRGPRRLQDRGAAEGRPLPSSDAYQSLPVVIGFGCLRWAASSSARRRRGCAGTTHRSAAGTRCCRRSRRARCGRAVAHRTLPPRADRDEQLARPRRRAAEGWRLAQPDGDGQRCREQQSADDGTDAWVPPVRRSEHRADKCRIFSEVYWASLAIPVTDARHFTRIRRQLRRGRQPCASRLPVAAVVRLRFSERRRRLLRPRRAQVAHVGHLVRRLAPDVAVEAVGPVVGRAVSALTRCFLRDRDDGGGGSGTRRRQAAPRRRR